VDAAQLPAIARGRAVHLVDNMLAVGDATLELVNAPGWNPAVTGNRRGRPKDARRRGRAVLRGCGVASSTCPSRLAGSLLGAGLLVGSDRTGKDAVTAALTAVWESNPARLVDAAAGLIGRGGGLTPEGDDFLGGLAAALAALGRDPPAFSVSDLRRRTTALSATLLDLSWRGLVVEPLIHVLNLDAPAQQWRPALRRLARLGHTTGRAWALGGAAAFLLCAMSRQNRYPLHKEQWA
jgi:hypothetical protein